MLLLSSILHTGMEDALHADTIGRTDAEAEAPVLWTHDVKT